MEFVFIVKEELEILMEKLINTKLNRRNTLVEIDFNAEINTPQSFVDGVSVSFADKIVPLLEEHFNRAIKKFEFADFNMDEGFVFSY